MAEPIRLQKFLSQAGVCSRREAERLMRNHRVKVNGKVASEMGLQVDPDVDKVEVNGEHVEDDRALYYIAVHKPIGMITSRSDPEGRRVISDLMPEWAKRTWPVGRLDWNSDGLILMTNDGRLTYLMTHPSHGVEKVYRVKVQGMLDHKDEGLKQMREGVTLDDGYQTSSAQVEVSSTTGQHTWLEIILHEGHNRQIRRMCEAVGLRVMRLRRVAIGSLELGELPAEMFRMITLPEVLSLYADAGEHPPRKLKTRIGAPPTETRKPRRDSDKPSNLKKKSGRREEEPKAVRGNKRTNRNSSGRKSSGGRSGGRTGGRGNKRR